ncbi:hypothetical protein V495_07159 [Pseudogymnoascus sp. VKM F-4514 (FW-929)]|nr:hypothetical protein V495_07159 [Pseudogymnoascus sp. VKM F-4514 (FW-929)]KFY59588.1 hypothetical protein V497_04218 [Pseudogymnoascus sp. VKM F-4516 (FW-969)]
MVGVPSSKGCALCLKRSVKCDEARPSCSQCRRGGRTCPGYTRGMKFVDETVKLRSSGKTASLRCRWDSPLVDKHDRPSSRRLDSVKSRSDATLNRPLQSIKAERDQILASFISAMFPMGAVSEQKSFLGSWLWHVPPRIGRFTALDHAASSLALAYFSLASNDQLLLRRSQYDYGLALRALALTIVDKTKAYDAETLCATLLLQFYESMVHQTHEWIGHAGGAARLMQLRGARRCYESPFEYSMFLACRGSMISAALAAGEPCFLDAEEWKTVPDGLIDFPLLPNTHQLDNEIFGYSVAVPGLLKDMKEATSSSPDCQALLDRAQQVRRSIKNWRERYVSSESGLRMPGLIIQEPNSGSEDLFSLKYIYKDVASACFITTCDALSIMINQGIDNLSSAGDYGKESRDLAEAICMSVDYCSQVGYCGSNAMTFSLPIARSALPAMYHEWATAQIEYFSGKLDALRIKPNWSHSPE